MNGQWIGRYAGSNAGTIILNVDEREDYFSGVAYLLDDDPKKPSFAAPFRTASKDRQLEFTVPSILPINAESRLTESWDKLKSKYSPEIVVPTSATVVGAWNEETLELSWITDIKTVGNCKLARSKADRPSELVALSKSWKEYKDYVAQLDRRRFLFRGQGDPRRLRTAFHRSGRADLGRYLAEDIPELHRHLSARTRHIFNLAIPDEMGAFFNLVQHHGYPTPLLDWTHSPYVAAFFAFRKLSAHAARSTADDKKVRIWMFDQARWKLDFPQYLQLLLTDAHLSVGEFIAIENERMIPQQAVSTLTNIDDVEWYLRTKETQTGHSYLQAIDLPVRDRAEVVNELEYMGITASSLFPGLDGACEALKVRNFPFHNPIHVGEDKN